MKKIWILIGIVLLIIILFGGAWWYLLMNGAPEGLSGISNPFGIFGGGSSKEFATTTPETEVIAQPLPAVPASLRKLSTSPVAGAVMISRDGATYVRFVERGTGHVFEINLASSITERITGTTIPRTARAIWSPQGSRVVLITETTGGDTRIFAGTIERTDEGEGVLNTTELESAARNITFASTGESVYYVTPSSGGSTGYEHNLKTNVRTVRFNSVLRDITVTWEPAVVAYTTPTAHMRGYAYAGAGFTRLFGGVNGLMVMPTANYRIVSYAENNSLISRTDTLDGIPFAIPVFPEKCAADPVRSTLLWCGAPSTLTPGAYPDLWYEGAISFNDNIWQVDVTTGNVTLMSVPSEAVGEAIDITDMQVGDAGDMLLFINKKDGALWVQEIM